MDRERDLDRIRWRLDKLEKLRADGLIHEKAYNI